MATLKRMTRKQLEQLLFAVLHEPPIERRMVGGWAPDWGREWDAADRLDDLDLLDGLIDCFVIFFDCAHSDAEAFEKLMQLRKELRALHRPQAMGTSGIGVDLDLGLRRIIEFKFGRSLELVCVVLEPRTLPASPAQPPAQSVRSPVTLLDPQDGRVPVGRRVRFVVD